MKWSVLLYVLNLPRVVGSIPVHVIFFIIIIIIIIIIIKLDQIKSNLLGRNLVGIWSDPSHS